MHGRQFLARCSGVRAAALVARCRVRRISDARAAPLPQAVCGVTIALLTAHVSFSLVDWALADAGARGRGNPRARAATPLARPLQRPAPDARTRRTHILRGMASRPYPGVM
jgi:hypothetical protein